MIKIDLQIAVKNKKIPTKTEFKKWVNQTLKIGSKKDFSKKNIEICIRIVDRKEIIKLNKTYRRQSKPTNILSFPYEIHRDFDKIPLLGDLVICSEVIEKEAYEQHIDLKTHWAHIVTHGTLHLLGYDHIKLKDRKKMEPIEQKILKKLG